MCLGVSNSNHSPHGILATMGMLKVRACDLEIQQHLRTSKDITDEAGSELARKIAYESLQMKKCSAAARKYGLDGTALAEIYQSIISAMMPEPLIRHGGPILVPSLIFMDDSRFEAYLSNITRFGTLDPSQDLDLHEIKRIAVALAHDIKSAGDDRRGPVRLNQPPPGCGATTAIMLALGLAGALASARVL